MMAFIVLIGFYLAYVVGDLLYEVSKKLEIENAIKRHNYPTVFPVKPPKPPRETHQ